MQIIDMANDTSLISSKPESAADPEVVAGSGLASATPSSTMRGALEAMHSVDLGHPNIVQTYKSTQRAVQVGPLHLRPQAADAFWSQHSDSQLEYFATLKAYGLLCTGGATAVPHPA